MYSQQVPRPLYAAQIWSAIIRSMEETKGLRRRKMQRPFGSQEHIPRVNSSESWNASDLELSPPHSPPSHPHHSTSADVMPPLKKSDSTEAEYFSTMGDLDGEEDGEEMVDEKALTKRDIHTLNEQRRRDIIKHGYSMLTELVPTCRPGVAGGKLSRAVLLQKALDYIQFMQGQSTRQEEQLLKLKREVEALRIMKENYEQIARTHQSTPASDAPQVPDHVKFMVFQGVSDQLFQSFNSSISVTSFDTLSSCIISWLEEYCKPQTLRELVIVNLQRANACPPQQSSLQTQ